MIDRHPLLNSDLKDEAWESVTSAGHAVAAAVVAQAEAIVRAYSRSVAAGHGPTAVLEIAGSLNVSQRTAENLLGEALLLVGQPAAAEAMTDGRLGHFHALALLDELTGLSDEMAAQVVTEVLAKVEHLPPARVRQLARRVALRLDPACAARRRAEAAERRCFTVSPAGDGMALLSLLIKAEAALRIAHRVEVATRNDGSGRSADQRRADWATDQLLGSGVGTHRVGGDAVGAAGAASATDEPPIDARRRRPTQVLVQVPVTVALGLSDHPGELAEYGPISAAHVRELITDAELRKVCVDATTGDVLQVEDAVVRPVPDPARVAALGGGDSSRERAMAEAVRAALVAMVNTPSAAPIGPEPGYRPSAALSRTVKIRSVRCDMVGCSQPARHCDDEHTVPYPAGHTELANLVSRSRRCHRAKQAGWTPTALAGGGTSWSAPSGRSYVVPSRHEPPPGISPGARLTPPRPPQGPDPPPDEQAGGDDDWDLDELMAELVGPAQLPTPSTPVCRDEPAADPPPF